MGLPPYYPPSPQEVPEDLMELPDSYRSQATMVLVSLFLFLAIYFGMMFLSLGIIVFCIIKFNIVSFFGILISGFFFLYLLKNVLKWESGFKTYDVEIFSEDHPKLWDFIERLCQETGAEIPHRVFVNFEVNACVFYNQSIFHLFMPTKKNLKLGLGLVNYINLTEFKAVLAHEFGHISQKSMKVGPYVYLASRIIDQMVNGRDFFDRFLETWSVIHPAISWPAWILIAILWVLRWILRGVAYCLFFFHQGLSQEMEFNADLFAVSTTGSDAPVHLLYKCYFADRCLQQTQVDLETAMDHGLYSADMFFHQNFAIDFLRRKARDHTLGVPPVLPEEESETTQVFKPDDGHIAGMWQSHPSNYDRELNAKEIYIRSEFDERSPWLLFDNPQEIRELVTLRYYRFFYKKVKETKLAEPEEVQEFINDERSETTYHPKYQGLYDNRNLLPGDIKILAEEVHRRPQDLAGLITASHDLYNFEVKHRAQMYHSHTEEFNLLNAIHNGWFKPKNDEFEFRGEWYDAKSSKKLIKKVEKELKQDDVYLGALDRKVFFTFYAMGLRTSAPLASELLDRYYFHMDLQKIWVKMKEVERPVMFATDFLFGGNQKSELNTGLFHEILSIFRDGYLTLKEILKTSEEMLIPEMKNMEAGEPLRDFLLKKRLIESISKYDTQINAQWIQKFLKQFQQVLSKVNRVHFKSLGGILAIQEQIAELAGQQLRGQ